jgi:hypothetical protein
MSFHTHTLANMYTYTGKPTNEAMILSTQVPVPVLKYSLLDTLDIRIHFSSGCYIDWCWYLNRVVLVIMLITSAVKNKACLHHLQLRV